MYLGSNVLPRGKSAVKNIPTQCLCLVKNIPTLCLSLLKNIPTQCLSLLKKEKLTSHWGSLSQQSGLASKCQVPDTVFASQLFHDRTYCLGDYLQWKASHIVIKSSKGKERKKEERERKKRKKEKRKQKDIKKILKKKKKENNAANIEVVCQSKVS